MGWSTFVNHWLTFVAHPRRDRGAARFPRPSYWLPFARAAITLSETAPERTIDQRPSDSYERRSTTVDGVPGN